MITTSNAAVRIEGAFGRHTGKYLSPAGITRHPGGIQMLFGSIPVNGDVKHSLVVQQMYTDLSETWHEGANI